jgi:hypothetical protein
MLSLSPAAGYPCAVHFEEAQCITGRSRRTPKGVRACGAPVPRAPLTSNVRPRNTAMVNPPSDYKPPESREELVARYANGERHFPDTELSGADLTGLRLDGASFEKWSWFFEANFAGASLRGTSFRECNVKCANFENADLTNACFELAAIESIELKGASLDGARFVGATFYGCTVEEGEEFPPR